MPRKKKPEIRFVCGKRGKTPEMKRQGNLNVFSPMCSCGGKWEIELVKADKEAQ